MALAKEATNSVYDDTIRGLSIFHIRNPVDSGFLQFELRSEHVCNNINSKDKDVIAQKTVRWFIGDTLKPHVYAWLSRLPQLSAMEIAIDVTQTLERIRYCIDEVLDLTDTSLSTRSATWICVSEILFPRHERSEVSRRLRPIMIKYFVSNSASESLERESLGILEEGDMFDKILALSDQKRIECAVVTKEMEKMTQYMITCIFRMGDLVLSSILAAYLSIGRAYTDHIINNTSGLAIEQLEAIMSVLERWLNCIPMPPPDTDNRKEIIRKGTICLYREVINRLTEQVYSLAVTDFPQTYRSILTLRHCMLNSDEYGRDRLVERLISDVDSKLLNIAVDTPIILNGYALCVESLRELDPSCVIMHKVCKVIKEYLKKRPDTVRQIITYITSEKRDDLAAHLAKKRGTIVDEDELTGANDDFLPEAMDTSNWRKWKADPPDATPGESGRFRQAADVFNMLVSVYGSKEMFVKEYRQLLAERLTSSNTKDPIFEMRYLDLLKLRFNEGELQQCEVMLKDIRESQRIDRAVWAKPCVPISACIISSHFWPKIDAEKVMELPCELEEGLMHYAKVFEQHKASRKLRWMRAVGCVELSLEMDGVKVDKVVSNANAAVLYLFLERDGWSVVDVADRLSISKGVAKRRLDWWRTQGLLSQSLPVGATAEEWSLTTQPYIMECARGAIEEDAEEDESSVEDATDAVDALEQYWNYTRNFIANHDNGEVKAERMHRIFRMFSSPSAQGPSLETVNAFLMRKVKLNLLTHNNGFFRVVRDSSK